MSENHRDETSLVLKSLSRIEDVQHLHTARLVAIESGIRNEMGTIAANTGQMSKSLDSIQETNARLVEVATGKWQVPTIVFILVVGILGVLMIAMQLASSGGSASVGADGFKIEQNSPQKKLNEFHDDK